MTVDCSRAVRPLIGLAVVALALSACAPAQSSSGSPAASGGALPSKILIGSTLPLTGLESKVGGRFKEGYELAIEEINKAGGVDVGGTKVPVELKLLDDTSDQAKANNLTQRLITQDKVDAFLGSYSTPLIEAQSTVAEQNKIPYVNGGGAATSIYGKGFKYVFGTLAPVTNLAKTEMEWLAEQQAAGKLPKPSKIAIAWENTSHGKDFDKGIKDFAAANPGNFEVVVDDSFALDGKDFSAILGKVKSAQADIFMADAHLPDFLTMHRQYVTAGMCNKVVTYGARGSEQDGQKALGKDNVAYILSAVWWNAQVKDAGGLNKSFVEQYKAKFGGKDPEWFQALGYETARALFTGIKDAKSLDKTKVRDALAALKMPSILPGGTLEFPAQSGQQASYPFVVQQNQPDGTAPIVYPATLATGKGVAPSPNCKG